MIKMADALIGGNANVGITAYALNYSLLTRTVEKRTFSSGWY